MAYSSNQRNRRQNRSLKAPFGIQIPSSLRDPTDSTFKNQHLSRLTNDDNARDVALGYLHDHARFAQLWNSTTLHPNTRRLMRKVIQMQTINAVCNR